MKISIQIDGLEKPIVIETKDDAQARSQGYEYQAANQQAEVMDANQAALQAIAQINSRKSWTPEELHRLDKGLCDIASMGRIDPEVIKKLRTARKNINKQ